MGTRRAQSFFVYRAAAVALEDRREWLLLLRVGLLTRSYNLRLMRHWLLNPLNEQAQGSASLNTRLSQRVFVHWH